MAENAPADTTVMASHEDVEFDLTLGAFSACLVRHPVLLEVTAALLRTVGGG